MTLCILKIGFMSVLLLMFFKLFGQESIAKFLAKQSFVVESSRDYTAADHPAITVCATYNGASGWRTEEILEDTFNKICNSSANADEGYKCITNSTFNLHKMVNFTVDGNQNTIDKSAALTMANASL